MHASPLGEPWKAPKNWRDDPITDPQVYAINTRRRLLGMPIAPSYPKSKGEAHDEIDHLHGLLHLQGSGHTLAKYQDCTGPYDVEDTQEEDIEF